jgi:hypothetical protein
MELLGDHIMKTLDEIKQRAHAIASMHFYADVDDLVPWEPFENYSDDWIQEEIENMAEMLVGQMLWAQSKQEITQ